jgi:hypothetical protein
MRKYSSIFLILISNLLFGQQNVGLAIDYFGQTPPGDSAVIFAPGIVSLTDSFTNGITFSPNGGECCYARYDGKYWTWGTIFYARYENNRWSEFRPAPFTDSTIYFDILPIFSPDGQKFLFSSARPSRQYNWVDLWMCERTGERWGKPVKLDSAINNPNDDESFSSIASDGNLYFNKDLTNTIWFSSYTNGTYSKAVKVTEPVNSKYGAGAAFISPDENYIIFASNRPEGYGGMDLYISFKRANGAWAEPQNLGPQINGSTDDVCARISPDLKYLFFTKGIKREYSTIYWVSTDFIERLKQKCDLKK